MTFYCFCLELQTYGILVIELRSPICASYTSIGKGKVPMLVAMLKAFCVGLYRFKKGGDRDSSAGIATHYGLHCPGIEYRRGENFLIYLDRPWDPHMLLYGVYRVSFPGEKRSERGIYHPPPSSAEIKGRVELYLPSRGFHGMLWGELSLCLYR
jgi:hypothetical protein